MKQLFLWFLGLDADFMIPQIKTQATPYNNDTI